MGLPEVSLEPREEAELEALESEFGGVDFGAGPDEVVRLGNVMDAALALLEWIENAGGEGEEAGDGLLSRCKGLRVALGLRVPEWLYEGVETLEASGPGEDPLPHGPGQGGPAVAGRPVAEMFRELASRAPGRGDAVVVYATGEGLPALGFGDSLTFTFGE